MSDDHTNLTEEDDISVDAIGLPAMPETGNGTQSQSIELLREDKRSRSLGTHPQGLKKDDGRNMSADMQEYESFLSGASDVSQCEMTFSTNSCSNENSLLDSQLPVRELKNWAFNNLLCKISDSISAEDFEKLKLSFEDELGNARAVDDITSTPKLLSSLKRRHLLSSDNLIYLQAALFNLRNMELVRLCAEYTREERDVFHFYTCTEEGDLGSQQTLIKVHVKGFDRLSLIQLDTIKLRISRLIFLPMEHIRLVCIQKSSSFILVFQLPKEYASYLKDLFEEDITLFNQISGYGIDSILVEGVTYRPKDHVYKETGTCENFQKQTHALPVSTSQISETSTFEQQQLQTGNAENVQKKKTFGSCQNLISKTMTSI
ncbi:uncharacterized protein LOC128245733 [Mya arenaria]|uniref:uncharacterized protein LOC128245733 n=1 Tax=Mya arenaria TaxID=6604 RepID=UPI0022E80BA5|nr:uncharacterized protein LOC128245733 [Mya arenaria]